MIGGEEEIQLYIDMNLFKAFQLVGPAIIQDSILDFHRGHIVLTQIEKLVLWFFMGLR